MKFNLTRILEPKTNGPEISFLLTNLLGVKVTDTTLTKEIEQHPDSPSLLSISDVLNNYGVENIGIKYNRDRLAELPLPFIAQIDGLKTDTLFFTVVKEVRDGLVNFFDPEKHNWSTLPKKDFIARCSDVALLIEAGDNAGETDYLKKRKEEKRKNIENYLIALSIPLLLVIAGIASFSQYGANALLPFVFTILTLAGAITGTLLLWYELDQHNPILQQICSAGRKVDCGAVLHSKAAKIAGISWSTIGFSYFMGMLLFSIFSGITNPATLFTMAWINAIAAPYVLFSIYYQWRIVKQWCVMCLSVVTILLLQFAMGAIGGWHTLLSLSAISINLNITVAIAFIIPFITAILLMRALQKSKEGKQANIDLQKLKHNKQVFEALLQKQKQVTESPDGLGVTIGNPNAAFKLIKVCNPYCGPCAKAHAPMEALLHNNPEVQLQLIFTASTKAGDIKTPPVKHLLAIAEKNDESILKQALDDWYLAENKDYEAFASKYPMNGELKLQDGKIDVMKDWTVKMEVEYTPTFFVSIPNERGLTGYYQLPKTYTVKDLKYFFSV